MKPLSSTAQAPLEFKHEAGVQKFRMSTNRISWLHTLSNKPTTSFNLTIKDARGFVLKQMPNCKTNTKEFGAMINLATNVGEEIELEVSGLPKDETLKVFIN